MKPRLLMLGAVVLSSVVCGCAGAPGKQIAAGTPIVPSEISNFDVLYSENCAGCHGSEGKGGAALALGDPVYLAIADDTILRRTATNGIPGTSMPAFAQSAGGMLTEKQIDVIVRGIRKRWSKPDALNGANPPPYSSTAPETPRAARKFTRRFARPATALPAVGTRRQVPSLMDLFSLYSTIKSFAQLQSWAGRT